MKETPMLTKPKSKYELINQLQKAQSVKVEEILEGSPREVAAKIAALRLPTIQVIVLKT